MEELERRPGTMAADDERAYFAEGSADENIATSLKCAAMSICARVDMHTSKTHTLAGCHLSMHTFGAARVARTRSTRVQDGRRDAH